jgi:hypothetical protein
LRYDLEIRGPVSQYGLHAKEHLLLKAVNAKHGSEFAALSLVMVTPARKAEQEYYQRYKNTPVKFLKKL